VAAGSALAEGFAPIARTDARILILGSLPSDRSIAAGEYYAHPQNAFWPIMRELVGASGNYTQRCAALVESGIALWDVLGRSERPGSLDANIRMDTAEPNDFNQFLLQHADVRRICFNGRKAEQMFRKFVRLDPGIAPPQLCSLPSTSPAHAAMSFDDKLERWRKNIVA
jgi:hypoxanthine-DNA glycosylase